MALITQILPAVGADSADSGAVTDSVIVDSPAADTFAADTMPADTIRYIMLVPPERPELPAHSQPADDTTGMSWILTALLALFVIVAVRFRTNSKYLGAMFKDAFEVRERGNVFDETVREESFIVLLNLLWCVSVGILLFTFVEWRDSIAKLTGFAGTEALQAPGGELSPDKRALGMGICSVIVLIWQVFMSVAYTTVGNVFGDKIHTWMWLTGYLATTGLSTLIFFPLALLAICYPAESVLILEVALGGVIAAKLIFIWKGFRIFFRDFTSWLLFLYYLCSLEIVPLILLIAACFTVCSIIL